MLTAAPKSLFNTPGDGTTFNLFDNHPFSPQSYAFPKTQQKTLATPDTPEQFTAVLKNLQQSQSPKCKTKLTFQGGPASQTILPPPNVDEPANQ